MRDRGVISGPGPVMQTLTLNPTNPYQGPALEDLEAPKRQTSLDGEAIKIVIHDVDSGPLCASKRRVILKRDPSDKAHRSKFCIKTLSSSLQLKLTTYRLIHYLTYK